MKLHFSAVIFLLFGGLAACDMKVTTQVPSHVAEFSMTTSDYPKLLSALDEVAASFDLNRVNAAPGLDELHGREVLFATYEVRNKSKQRGTLTVTDVKAPGKVLIRVYEDGFIDADQGSKFVKKVANIVDQFGGTLSKTGDEGPV